MHNDRSLLFGSRLSIFFYVQYSTIFSTCSFDIWLLNSSLVWVRSPSFLIWWWLGRNFAMGIGRRLKISTVLLMTDNCFFFAFPQHILLLYCMIRLKCHWIIKGEAFSISSILCWNLDIYEFFLRIDVVNQIHGVPVDWALGAFIVQTTMNRTEYSDSSVSYLNSYDSPGLVPLLFIIVVVFTALSILRWRKPRLKTIYDMEKGRYIITRVSQWVAHISVGSGWTFCSGALLTMYVDFPKLISYLVANYLQHVALRSQLVEFEQQPLYMIEGCGLPWHLCMFSVVCNVAKLLLM